MVHFFIVGLTSIIASVAVASTNSDDWKFACIEKQKTGFVRDKNMAIGNFKTDNFILTWHVMKAKISAPDKFITSDQFNRCSAMGDEITCLSHDGADVLTWNATNLKFVYSHMASDKDDVLISHGNCEKF